jgi:hypothetical protein
MGGFKPPKKTSDFVVGDHHPKTPWCLTNETKEYMYRNVGFIVG